jgi:fucose 4-O-acetylase-like acetyltransferase
MIAKAAESVMNQNRNYYFDNAKFILMFLVVFGHVVSLFIEHDRICRGLYLFVYIFHIPAFAFISGYWTKLDYGPGYYRKIIKNYIVPYVILEIAYQFYDFCLFKNPKDVFQFLLPYWIIWYLLSLAFWKMFLPLVYRLRYPVVYALIFSLLCGCWNEIGHFLALSRTIVFFPFFLLGFLIKEDQLEIPQSLNLRILAMLLLFALSFACYLCRSSNPVWLHGADSYEVLGQSIPWGIAIRTVIYLLAFITGGCFFILVPRSKTWYSFAGQRTFYCFVLHGFLIRLAYLEGVLQKPAGWAAYPLFILISLIVVFVFTTHAVEHLFKPLIKPAVLEKILLKS